jgi:ADP-dependent NAD(P)H-hydrate dehydratase / NAD(P)H-hydrate epimerase
MMVYVENRNVNMLVNSSDLWLVHLPQPNATSNKYSRGNVVIYGGYPVTGAARLSALAAARIGVGLTTIAVPELALSIYATSLLSVMVKPYQSDVELRALLSDERISAYLIGPGAGVNEQTKTCAITMLASKKPVVLDADAITVFKDDVQSLSSAIKGVCVMTPHEGEFVRLFGAVVNREQAVLQAAAITGAFVVLKGAETMIASPQGELIVNKNASPYLATAGSGDVLAGMITGLLAQGMPALYAIAAATWLHGECANSLGVGLIAEDIPNILPQVLKGIMK